jgi:hypothetical protein
VYEKKDLGVKKIHEKKGAVRESAISALREGCGVARRFPFVIAAELFTRLPPLPPYLFAFLIQDPAYGIDGRIAGCLPNRFGGDKRNCAAHSASISKTGSSIRV